LNILITYPANGELYQNNHSLQNNCSEFGLEIFYDGLHSHDGAGETSSDDHFYSQLQEEGL